MTITVNFHSPVGAESESYSSPQFDAVAIDDTNGNRVSLFLPYGRGQAVADAINAAISPASAEVIE
jgi:hypothetical protein